MGSARRPPALLVMSRDTFQTQFDAERLDRLRDHLSFPAVLWTDDLDDPALAPALAEVEILLTSWGAPRLDARRLAAMRRLRAVLHCAGSVRPVVSEEFWRRGIVVSSCADANAVPVAEFTFASIVLAGKKAQFLALDAREHRDDWSYLHAHGELSNYRRTIGVVGFSRIGRRVVRLLQQLDGVTCLVADPHADPLEVAEAGGHLVALPEMLPRVSVLSLHAPDLPTTRGMIGARELALLPDGATVVNTARGALLDTAALERECATGRLYAVLDVTSPEPLPAASPLYELRNVVITPHVAGSLGSETFRMTDVALDELGRYLVGQPLRHQVLSRDLELIA
ncbi:phosphoglycerate dehydrogenase-like enzyme [Kineococcus xinjiangensis]|uniref:Phosphoglycerate dehydrogenase-like enzyme n=1 Tax=Kineococcus xinjiangensis TaxID=512762 RepID=A0A2S6IE37_9ACTN|nr:hydroxyacid dehydrogenase [Kineococcus xinjiangensis]PPK92471.1 phosphoglycerate dehydrogenase-like enzyme [Kineococcus xinjiangensis]